MTKFPIDDIIGIDKDIGIVRISMYAHRQCEDDKVKRSNALADRKHVRKNESHYDIEQYS